MPSDQVMKYLKSSDFLSFKRCGNCRGIYRIELCIRKYEQHYESPITSTYNPNGCGQWR